MNFIHLYYTVEPINTGGHKTQVDLMQKVFWSLKIVVTNDMSVHVSICCHK